MRGRHCPRDQELKETPEAELEELTRIYVERGLDDSLARQVAIGWTEKNASLHIRATNSASPRR